MKEMINLALQSEYTFKKCFGFVSKAIQHAQGGYIGVADVNNTYSHAMLEKACKKHNGPLTEVKSLIKPIYGVRILVTPDVNKKIEGQRGFNGHKYIFIAKNNDGLKEIYKLVKTAWDNFFWYPIISAIDVFKLSENVFVIAESFDFIERVDYIGLSVTTPKNFIDYDGIEKVAINNNWYSKPDDKKVYQLLAGTQKRPDGYQFQFEQQTYQQHILSTKEWYRLFKNEDAINNTHVIANQCEVKLQKAPMVRFPGVKIDLGKLCRLRAKKRGVDLENKEYNDRLNRELALIEEKDYSDYFLIVDDMVSKAKKKMLVGPARGSSGGSLVCYLLSITTIDPLKYGLLFERFIDINRDDLPDIDVDFPDTKRKAVVRQLIKDYGEDKVSHISNINRLSPRAAIAEFSKGLGVPLFETEAIKDGLIERSSGDSRANLQIHDTFHETKLGRAFIEKFPEMVLCEEIENHSNHAGTHAAGIIVCGEPIDNFVGINSRDKLAMCDKKIAEHLNLLKIDVLGLRTLSILEQTADLVGFDYDTFYNLEPDDKKVYEVFEKERFSGIFQFEGQALQSITRSMGCCKFDDIVAITALARPGPMQSGSATTFCERRIGNEPVEYYSKNENFIKATVSTYGCIIYQEQIMKILHEYGSMDWKDVSALRRAMGKSVGDEFFNQYKEEFINGAIGNGDTKEQAEKVWEKIIYFGNYGFNKSHSVGYSIISYWTAWAKTYYPLEFAVANLNNSKNDESSLMLLRDMAENDGIHYIALDPELSIRDWSVQNNKIYGGLINIPGIGPAKANKIVKDRLAGTPYTPAIRQKMINPSTPFDDLYPCKTKFGKIYKNPSVYGIDYINYIKEANDIGEYIIIGKILEHDVLDSNDYNAVMKRGGKQLDGDTLYMRIFVQDDTDKIQCRIDRFAFENLNGSELNKSFVDEETWVCIKGIIRNDYRMITIVEVFNMTDFDQDDV